MSDKNTAEQEDKQEKKQVDTANMNLYQKLAAITGEIGAIKKGGKNTEQHYDFIEYAAVAATLRTLFSQYHVMCIPTMGERSEQEIKSSNGKIGYHVLIKFTFKFVNSDKPDETESIEWVGEAIDYGDKATNKAATAALKYCLMRTFNVSEKSDEDADSASPEVGESTSASRSNFSNLATPKQKQLIKDLLTKIGVAPEDMQGYLIEQYGIKDTERMTKNDASKVIEMLGA